MISGDLKFDLRKALTKMLSKDLRMTFQIIFYYCALQCLEAMLVQGVSEPPDDGARNRASLCPPGIGLTCIVRIELTCTKICTCFHSYHFENELRPRLSPLCFIDKIHPFSCHHFTLWMEHNCASALRAPHTRSHAYFLPYR